MLLAWKYGSLIEMARPECGVSLPPKTFQHTCRSGRKKYVSARGIANMPGFAESLRLLLVEERYSETDVALMFSVSRERIRQLAKRFGVKNPDGHAVGLNAVRVWDDAAHRFRPVNVARIRRDEERRGVLRRKVRWSMDLLERQQHIANTVQRMRVELGRDPFNDEIADAVLPLRVRGEGTSCALAHLLNYFEPRRQFSAKEKRVRFRSACGLGEASPRGHRAHKAVRSR